METTISTDLLGPLSPLSPFCVSTSSIPSQVSLLEPNDEENKIPELSLLEKIPTLDSTDNMNSCTQQLSASSSTDYFEQYISNTFAMIDKPELLLESDFSPDLLNWINSGRDTDINADFHESLKGLSLQNNSTSNKKPLPTMANGHMNQDKYLHTSKSFCTPSHETQSPNGNIKGFESLQGVFMPEKSQSYSIQQKTKAYNHITEGNIHLHIDSNASSISKISSDETLEKQRDFLSKARTSSFSSECSDHSRESATSKLTSANTSPIPLFSNFKNNFEVPSQFQNMSTSVKQTQFSPDCKLQNSTPSSVGSQHEKIETFGHNNIESTSMPPVLSEKSLATSTIMPGPNIVPVETIPQSLKQGQHKFIPSDPEKNSIGGTSGIKHTKDKRFDGNLRNPTNVQEILDSNKPVCSKDGRFGSVPSDSYRKNPSLPTFDRKNGAKHLPLKKMLLTKDLPELPPGAKVVKHQSKADGKLANIDRVSQSATLRKVPGRSKITSESDADRQASVYDWECISNNLNLIKMSLGNWNDNANVKVIEDSKKFERPGPVPIPKPLQINMNANNSPCDIPSYYFQDSSPIISQRNESLQQNPVNIRAPRAVDITFMERRKSVNQGERYKQNQHVRGYDLCEKQHKSVSYKHNNYIRNLSLDKEYDTKLPSSVINAHEKSASVHNLSNTYVRSTTDLPCHSNPIFRDSFDFTTSANIVHPSPATSDFSPKTNGGLPLKTNIKFSTRSMSVPSIYHLDPEDQSRSQSSGENRPCRDYIEEEALLPEPSLGDYKDYTNSTAPDKPSCSPSKHLPTLQNASSYLISSANTTASMESFTASLTEAISMPASLVSNSGFSITNSDSNNYKSKHVKSHSITNNKFTQSFHHIHTSKNAPQSPKTSLSKPMFKTRQASETCNFSVGNAINSSKHREFGSSKIQLKKFHHESDIEPNSLTSRSNQNLLNSFFSSSDDISNGHKPFTSRSVADLCSHTNQDNLSSTDDGLTASLVSVNQTPPPREDSLSPNSLPIGTHSNPIGIPIFGNEVGIGSLSFHGKWKWRKPSFNVGRKGFS